MFALQDDSAAPRALPRKANPFSDIPDFEIPSRAPQKPFSDVEAEPQLVDSVRRSAAFLGIPEGQKLTYGQLRDLRDAATKDHKMRYDAWSQRTKPVNPWAALAPQRLALQERRLGVREAGEARQRELGERGVAVREAGEARQREQGGRRLDIQGAAEARQREQGERRIGVQERGVTVREAGEARQREQGDERLRISREQLKIARDRMALKEQQLEAQAQKGVQATERAKALRKLQLLKAYRSSPEAALVEKSALAATGWFRTDKNDPSIQQALMEAEQVKLVEIEQQVDQEFGDPALEQIRTLPIEDLQIIIRPDSGMSDIEKEVALQELESRLQ